jgi:long-chain acyl-CoA synthetase
VNQAAQPKDDCSGRRSEPKHTNNDQKKHALSVRDMSDSPFPLRPVWEPADAFWHKSYPPGVPPRIDYEPLRVEELFRRAAVEFPDRPVIHYFGTTWTYSKLLSHVQTVASNLRNMGIGIGDRVMMVLPNCPEFIAVWFAIHWLGAEVVPANPLMSGNELADLAKKTKVKVAFGLDVRLKPLGQMTQQFEVPWLVVVSLGPHLPLHFRLPYMLKAFLERKPKTSTATQLVSVSSLFEGSDRIESAALTSPDLPAILQPTGGTTGSPKVAILNHSNLCANVAQLHAWCAMEPGTESFLSVLPYFHIYGATCAMLSPISGGATLLIQARFHQKRTLKLLQKHKPRSALLVPFMISALNDEMRKKGIRLEGLNLCMSGAAPLTEEVAREFEHLTGATIMEGFGLSEASPVTHSNPAQGETVVGSIGLPLPNTEIRLVDLDDGVTQVSQGEDGELLVRGPQVMQGYLDDPEETANTLRNGWLYTGDVARMDENGYFTIVDRKKDMIISGGLNVYPTEVEETIVKHPAVKACAIVGVPDSKYGELVCAWVVPAKGGPLDVSELKAFCKDNMSGYKVPKQFRLCDSLPENFLGKIRRVELRKRAA